VANCSFERDRLILTDVLLRHFVVNDVTLSRVLNRYCKDTTYLTMPTSLRHTNVWTCHWPKKWLTTCSKKYIWCLYK